MDPVEETPVADLEMEGQEEGESAEAEDASLLPDVEPDLPKRTTFLDYLKSPIVELLVGTGDETVTLTAHQAQLVKSPWFAERLEAFSESDANRRIELPNEDLQAVGSFLEYLYMDEYFPKRVHPSSKDSPLEEDPSIPMPDHEGVALLRHARVYTLADKFAMPNLRSLAHSKIHRTNSTARGEIAYARYVYKHTGKDDATIRKPVAAFWATRSHILRHEAEDEFRAMCLEFPQFGFDVLSLVLDQKEKRSGGAGASVEIQAGPSGTPHSEKTGRKRARVSQG